MSPQGRVHRVAPSSCNAILPRRHLLPLFEGGRQAFKACVSLEAGLELRAESNLTPQPPLQLRQSGKSTQALVQLLGSEGVSRGW